MVDMGSEQPRVIVPPFSMVAVFKPLSLSSAQSKKGGRYQADVARVARGYTAVGPEHVAGQCVFPGVQPLYARIIYFHTYPREDGDTDNIAKPLLDALCGVVYEDDRFIKRCAIDVVLFRDFAELDISFTDLPDRPAEDLLSVLTGGHTDILYIEIGLLTEQRLELGRQP